MIRIQVLWYNEIIAYAFLIGEEPYHGHLQKVGRAVGETVLLF